MCPVTCGLCTPEGDAGAETTVAVTPPVSNPNVCEDAANNCETLKEYCSSEQTSDMMKSQCRMTCGFCQVDSISSSEQLSVADNSNKGGAAPPATTAAPTEAPTGCQDDPALNCAGYTSFCNNPNTDVPKKCPRTCGTCPDQTTQAAETTAAATQAPTTTPATTEGTCKYYIDWNDIKHLFRYYCC